jgi:hypothetical protein
MTLGGSLVRFRFSQLALGGTVLAGAFLTAACGGGEASIGSGGTDPQGDVQSLRPMRQIGDALTEKARQGWIITDVTKAVVRVSGSW